MDTKTLVVGQRVYLGSPARIESMGTVIKVTPDGVDVEFDDGSQILERYPEVISFDRNGWFDGGFNLKLRKGPRSGLWELQLLDPKDDDRCNTSDLGRL